MTNIHDIVSVFELGENIKQGVIYIYSAYGSSTSLSVEGRIFNIRHYTESDQEDSKITNFWANMKFLFNDERRNAAITLTVNGENYKTISDAEGYFSFELFFTLPSLATNCQIELYLDDQPNIKARCNPYILDDKTRLGIISDFDDTVIVSNVTSKLGLFVQLFLKNYKQREAIHGMAKLFKLLLAKDTNKKDAPLFFISASPRQLHRSIKKFLQLHEFPKHTIITKKIHGRGADKIFSHKTYKKRQILKLIKLYPTVKWILFGDSGEHDKAIYKSIKDEFPNHIDSIYIRDVRSGDIKEIAL